MKHTTNPKFSSSVMWTWIETPVLTAAAVGNVNVNMFGDNPRSGAGAEEQLLCAATVLGQVFVKAAE